MVSYFKNEQNVDIISCVIMPNHLHIILHFHHENFNLNTIIANGKRFIAYQMIIHLEANGNTVILFMKYSR